MIRSKTRCRSGDRLGANGGARADAREVDKRGLFFSPLSFSLTLSSLSLSRLLSRPPVHLSPRDPHGTHNPHAGANVVHSGEWFYSYACVHARVYTCVCARMRVYICVRVCVCTSSWSTSVRLRITLEHAQRAGAKMSMTSQEGSMRGP